MATPTQAQARSHYARQAAISAAAAATVRQMLGQRLPLAEVAARLAAYQIAAVTAAVRTVAAWADAPQMTDPAAFAGVSSAGFPVIEPLIATIDRIEPAPPEPLPAPWWDDASAFMASVEMLVLSEVADAARTATQVELTGQGWSEYVRVLNPPSCNRCTVLAGRVYRYSTGFDRHPGCDCAMVPVDNLDAAKAEGLVADPMEAFEQGQVTGLSKADARAIRDGADIATVVNAKRAGIRAPAGVTNAYTTDLFGHRVKATKHGTTKRAAWRKANPTRLVRLRPESIYEFAKDQADAIRLLRLYGYIT